MGRAATTPFREINGGILDSKPRRTQRSIADPSAAVCRTPKSGHAEPARLARSRLRLSGREKPLCLRQRHSGKTMQKTRIATCRRDGHATGGVRPHASEITQISPSAGLPELTGAFRISLLSCRRAGITRLFTPLWESSGESRVEDSARPGAVLRSHIRPEKLHAPQHRLLLFTAFAVGLYRPCAVHGDRAPP
jgi:hypothetical protein